MQLVDSPCSDTFGHRIGTRESDEIPKSIYGLIDACHSWMAVSHILLIPAICQRPLDACLFMGFDWFHAQPIGSKDKRLPCWFVRHPYRPKEGNKEIINNCEDYLVDSSGHPFKQHLFFNVQYHSYLEKQQKQQCQQWSKQSSCYVWQNPMLMLTCILQIMHKSTKHHINGIFRTFKIK